jgi:hypothetical protein
VSAESPAKNVPECKAALAPTEQSDAWRGKISSAKSVTAPIPKVSDYVLTAKSSHAKPLSRDPSATVTANIFQGNPKIVSFKFAVANLLVIAYGFSRSCDRSQRFNQKIR